MTLLETLQLSAEAERAIADKRHPFRSVPEVRGSLNWHSLPALTSDEQARMKELYFQLMSERLEAAKQAVKDEAAKL